MIRRVFIVLAVLCSSAHELPCNLEGIGTLQATTFKNKRELESFNGSTTTVYATHLYELASNLNVFIFETHIPHICNRLLGQLSGVAEIELQDIGNTQFEPYAFKGINNLKTFSIYYSFISSIPSGTFSNSTIVNIRIEGNRVQTIASGAFDNTSDLEFVTLNENQLKTIDPDWFKNCPKLSHLDLSENFITEIPKYAFKNIATGRYCKIKELKVLCPEIILTGNRISVISSKALDGMKYINHLVLDGNMLSDLPNAFNNLEISILSLKTNEIRCVSREVLESFRNFGTVYLDFNKLMPECLDMLNAFKKRHFIYITF